ncbi:hypothetical protein DCAR_0100812 [Daucus carota subsp. sativus]|uniref:Bifunctional inhibitor/plant lipid transfer protein/seed storage helical domain-containing protein n=1 Tax=Daucus carota subsp. sativus TaxID=79200 RepID=A0AAF1AIP9_DAUCS|nr:PREDICTED: non-specific lipid-transfer protein A-like [Daucus carota subsp. sativus]WOG81661.1 hypothetical protein DCAR_0100812 [Daucus carota subsp. sativus]
MARILYLAVALVVVTHSMVEQGEARSCNDLKIQQTGTKCSSFTSGDQAMPSGECCNAMRALRALVKTRTERRQYCFCVHELTSQNRHVRGSPSYPAARFPRIDSLPKKCGLPFLFSVDPKFNCNTVN